MKTPGPNGQVVHLAAEQSHASIEVELEEEEDEQSEADDYSDTPQQIKTELDEQPYWCDTDSRPGNSRFKAEAGASECDVKDLSCEETKTEKSDELQLTYAGADGTLIWEDGVHPLKIHSNSEERQGEESYRDAKSQNGPLVNVITLEQYEAEDAEALQPGGKCVFKMEIYFLVKTFC